MDANHWVHGTEQNRRMDFAMAYLPKLTNRSSSMRTLERRPGPQVKKSSGVNEIGDVEGRKAKIQDSRQTDTAIGPNSPIPAQGLSPSMEPRRDSLVSLTDDVHEERDN